MAATVNLGVSVAVLSAVAVEVVSRSDSDVVSAVLDIDGSGGDGKVVLLVTGAERVDPVLLDRVSTSPHDRASCDALRARLGVDFGTGAGR